MDKITENLKRHHGFFDVLAVYVGKYLPWSGSHSHFCEWGYFRIKQVITTLGIILDEKMSGVIFQ